MTPAKINRENRTKPFIHNLFFEHCVYVKRAKT